jgi:outer membrane protein assembly factor BamB
MSGVSLTVGGQPVEAVLEGSDGLFAATVDLAAFATAAESGPQEIQLEAIAEDALGQRSVAGAALLIMQRRSWHAVTPTAVAGVTTSADGTIAYVATEGGSVHSLRTEDGTEVCRFDAGAGGFRAPTVSADGTRVYVGTASGMRAFAAAPSCAPIWSAQTGQVAQGRPAEDAATGRVFMTTRADGAGGGLHAVSSTGTVLWSRGDLGLLRGGPTLLPSLGIVVVGSDDHFLHAVRMDDGQDAWSAETGGEIEAEALAVGSRIYVGSDDFNVYAFNGADGSRAWDAPFPTERLVTTAPAVDADGNVYVTSRDRRLYKLSTGRELAWSYEVPSGIDYSGPALDRASRLVLFGETGMTGSDGLIHGVLHGVDQLTRQAVWTATLDGTLSVTPEIVAGRVIVGTSLGQVYAFFLDSASARSAIGRTEASDDSEATPGTGDAGEGTCESVGGTCRADGCRTFGEVRVDATCASDRRCCVDETEEAAGSPADCAPVCLNQGTAMEGWYRSCDSTPIRFGACAGCLAVCGRTGWFSTCDLSLVLAEACSA